MSDPESSYASEPEHPAPESIDVMTADRKKRQTRVLLGGLIAAAVLGGGGYGLVRYQDAQQKKAISTAWSALSRCLTGGDLDKGERPSQRFRDIQLVAMTMNDGERTLEGSEKAWPISCSPLGHTLNEVMRGAGMAQQGKKDLASASEALAKALGEGSSLSADLTDAIDEAFDLASEAKIEVVNGVPAPKAPLPQRPLSATFLATVEPLSRASFTLKNAFTDAHPAGALRLLVEEQGVDRSPFLCTFDAKAPAAHCKTLPKSIAEGHGLRLLGTADDDSDPLIFAGDRGTAGVYRADTGDKIDAMYSYGGYAKKDGSAAVLGYQGEPPELIITRRSPAGAVPRTKIEVDFEIGNLYYSSQLLWNALLLRGVSKQKERKLYAASLDFKGEPFKDLGAVGVLPEPGLVVGGDEPPHIAGCRTDKAMVVRVKGYDNDFMSFYIGGKWTPPISPEVTGGILSCHGTEAVVTRLEPAGESRAWKTTVTQCHCTSAGCQREVVALEKFLKGRYEFGPREGHVDAVDLDGKLLMVWAAGDRGGVRMRLGKPDEIERAQDQIIYDDMVKDGAVGKLSTLFGLRLFSRDGFAILLLNTVAGIHALRIDSGGKVAPVTVKWG